METVIICFRCNASTKRAIDKLLATGEYSDYSEVISVAIANLAVLQESSLRGKGDILLDLRPGAGSVSAPLREKDSVSGGQQQEPIGNPDGVAVPPLFRLSSNLRWPQTFPALPRADQEAEGIIPLDRWVFGQYNRLLPAKATCRAIMTMLQEEPEGVLLETAAREIAREATLLGVFLLEHDRKHSISRDEMLSTAFPTMRADDLAKSELRYAHHFVANVDGQGRVHGLLVDLKLVSPVWTDDGSVRLLLTEPGWNFAVVANPVLDGRQEHPAQKFSDEERQLLLQHIISHVPAEVFAYRVILTHIARGSTTPEALDRSLEPYRRHDNGTRKVSESFFATQRSGAVSRMADLGLLTRSRKGVRVFYHMTDAGKEFLHEVGVLPDEVAQGI